MSRRGAFEAQAIQEVFIIRALKEHLPAIFEQYIFPEKLTTVLDVGCGNQPFRVLLENTGLIYKSMDVQQNDYENVDYLGFIDQSLPISNTTKFDLILCTEVLEHVLDWQQSFANFSCLTDKSGYVLITCPFFYPLHEVPYDYWRPTPFAIQQLAVQHGFEVVIEKKAGDFWDVLGTSLAWTYIKAANQSFLSRIVANLLYRLKQILLKSLVNQSYQKYLAVESPLFMSNIFLLKKK